MIIKHESQIYREENSGLDCDQQYAFYDILVEREHKIVFLRTTVMYSNPYTLVGPLRGRTILVDSYTFLRKAAMKNILRKC